MYIRFLKIFSIVFLIIQIIIFKIISANTAWVEHVFIRRFFSFFTRLLRLISSIFPFSIGLVLIYAITVLILVLIIKSIYGLIQRKISFKSLLINILSVLSPLYFYYMISWGLAYHRAPLHELFKLNKSDIKEREVIYLTHSLIDSANFYRSKISEDLLNSYTLNKVFKKADIGFKQLAQSYPFLKYRTPSIKKAAGSTLMAYMGTSGVYMFPTGEANVNTINQIYDAPYTTTHEMAHQLGIASEDEANFIAYLACKDHPDTLFRYSAYYGTVFRFINRISRTDSLMATQLYDKLSDKVKIDRKAEVAVWRSFQNPIEKYLIGPFYDIFLKSNGVTDGSNSYDKVIELMVAERRKKSSTYIFHKAKPE